jgi:hypothetical protein
MGAPGKRGMIHREMKTSTKYATTASSASSGSPAPQAMPIPVTSQIVAAVVSPLTRSSWTKISPAPMKDIAEAVLGDKHEESGGGADDGVGAQACALVADFAFNSDDGREHERRSELRSLKKTLPVTTAHATPKMHGEIVDLRLLHGESKGNAVR